MEQAMYCKKCMSVAINCKCAHTKKHKLIKENDPVYLITLKGIWALQAEDMLRQHGIPCLKRATSGAGVSMYTGGVVNDIYRMYVPYGAYIAAKEIVELFDTVDAVD